MRMVSFRRSLLLLTVVAFDPSAGASGATQSALPSLGPMLSRVMRSVVTIHTEGQISSDEEGTLDLESGQGTNASPQEAQNPYISETGGTGVVTDGANGFILTNDHVIEGATSITVSTAGGETYQATLVGADADTDLAVLKIDAKGLMTAEVADSPSLQVGDYVVAVGNPFGLEKSATFGIVSALNRTGLGLDIAEGLIQTDAALNPGNSGGALVGLDGKIVGINTAILRLSGANAGIGFAVPIRTAVEISQQLISFGEIRRGQLGVGVQDNTPDLAAYFGLRLATGALANDVPPRSPGGVAGIKVGDAITAVNGQRVNSAADLKSLISSLSPKTAVSLSIARSDRFMEIHAVLGTKTPEKKNENANYVEGGGLLSQVILHPLDASSEAFGKIAGCLVSSVVDGTPAAEAGLQPGDVIISVNQTGTTSPQMVIEISKRAKELLLVELYRDGHKTFIVVKQ